MLRKLRPEGDVVLGGAKREKPGARGHNKRNFDPPGGKGEEEDHATAAAVVAGVDATACAAVIRQLTLQLLALRRPPSEVSDWAQAVAVEEPEALMQVVHSMTVLVREVGEELPEDVDRAAFWAGVKLVSYDATSTKSTSSWQLYVANWTGPPDMFSEAKDTKEHTHFGWCPWSELWRKEGGDLNTTASCWAKGCVSRKRE